MGGGEIAQRPPGVDLREQVSGDTITQNGCPSAITCLGVGACGSVQETSSRSTLTTFIHPRKEVVLVTHGSVPSLGAPPCLAVEFALGACRTLTSGAELRLLGPGEESLPCTPQPAGKFPRSL